MDAVQTQIRRRIVSRGRGGVFTPKDFLDIGGRDAVDQAIGRLVRAGLLRRVARGLYHYPRTNDRLGIDVPAAIDDLADALARQTGSCIMPSGAVAANRLGLSTQVPAEPTYLSDGRTRSVRVGNTTIRLKHVSPKRMSGRAMSATVFQALHFLGKDGVSDSVVDALRKRLSPAQRRSLLHDARYATDWIADIARRIADESEVPARG